MFVQSKEAKNGIRREKKRIQCATHFYIYFYIIYLFFCFRHNKYRNNRSIEKQGILGKSKFNVFLLIQMVFFVVVIIISII